MAAELFLAGLVGGIVLWVPLYIFCRQWLNGPVLHILTGDQRRAAYPAEQPIGPGAEAVLQRSDVKVTRSFHTLRNGEKIFYQLLAPADREPGHVLVFLHGYTSHSELYLEAFSEVAKEGALIVLPDLPCHGRSDGMIGYIPDWWSWVETVWEFMDAVVLPLRKAQSAKAPRKLFCAGNSLGGGLTACLAVQRPTFFDGLVLIAPMLFVSDEIKPPMVVQVIFRRLLGPFKLTWPLTPSKPTDSFDFRVPSQGKGFTNSNPLSMCGLKPRLASALEMGMVFPEWMEEKLKEVRTPFLVLHGANDKVTDSNVSKRLYQEAPVTDKTLTLYEGAYHCELLCCTPGSEKLIGEKFLAEQNAQTKQCLKDIADWVAKRA